MEAITAALADQQAELTDLLAGLKEPDWLHPSRCTGWTVADVVLHLAQTDELAAASLSGRFAEALAESARGPARDVDDAAAQMVERERGRPDLRIRDRWQRGADELTARLRAADPHERVVWVSGELSTSHVGRNPPGGDVDPHGRCGGGTRPGHHTH